jgi:hypothetical protein
MPCEAFFRTMSAEGGLSAYTDPMGGKREQEHGISRDVDWLTASKSLTET